MAALGEHKGRKILGQSIIMRKTGDGLSKSVKVDPVEIEQGDTVYVLYEAQCIDVHHPPEKRHDPGFGGVYEVPVLDAGTATIVDEAFVGDLLKQQADRNVRWEAEQHGQAELRDQALIADHDSGAHDEFVDHCPRCLVLRDHDEGKHEKRRKQGCPACEAAKEAADLADAEKTGDEEPT